MIIQNISFELLKIFIKVAETKNISKAAQELYISQPAVSQSIKKLETEIEGVLFYRSNKGLKLTEEGETFYNYVINAISLIDKGIDSFKNYKEFKEGTVNIGIPATLTKIVLNNVMQDFHKDFPNIKFNIVNNLSSNLVNELGYGKLDFVVLIDSASNFKDFNHQTLLKLNHKFVYNTQFFNIEDNIELSKLLSYPLILQKKESNTRIMLDKFLTSKQLIAFPQMEVVSQDLVKFFAKSGLGVGYCFENSIDEDLKVVNVKEELPTSNIILLTNKNNSISFAGKKFLEYLLKYYK